jgi:DDE superfamily endonuclease
MAVRKAFADCNTEVDLIPGGYTSKLQPMDAGLNKPFKGHVIDNFTDWLIVNRNKKDKARCLGVDLHWIEPTVGADCGEFFSWRWLYQGIGRC